MLDFKRKTLLYDEFNELEVNNTKYLSISKNMYTFQKGFKRLTLEGPLKDRLVVVEIMHFDTM